MNNHFSMKSPNLDEKYLKMQQPGNLLNFYLKITLITDLEDKLYGVAY